MPPAFRRQAFFIVLSGGKLYFHAICKLFRACTARHLRFQLTQRQSLIARQRGGARFAFGDSAFMTAVRLAYASIVFRPDLEERLRMLQTGQISGALVPSTRWRQLRHSHSVTPLFSKTSLTQQFPIPFLMGLLNGRHAAELTVKSCLLYWIYKMGDPKRRKSFPLSAKQKAAINRKTGL